MEVINLQQHGPACRGSRAKEKPAKKKDCKHTGAAAGSPGYKELGCIDPMCVQNSTALGRRRKASGKHMTSHKAILVSNLRGRTKAPRPVRGGRNFSESVINRKRKGGRGAYQGSLLARPRTAAMAEKNITAPWERGKGKGPLKSVFASRLTWEQSLQKQLPRETT